MLKTRKKKQSRKQEAVMPPVTGLSDVDGNSVPLERVAIHATVLEAASRVTVLQVFRNKDAKPIEATYCFPLEDGSAVCGFEIRTGGRTIAGEIEEKEKAFELYDKAMEDGNAGYLLDQERDNIFHVSVGNIAPGQAAEIEITYVAELPVADDAIRLMIPTTVAPRYSPANADPLDADRISPPTAISVPYETEILVEILDAQRVESVSSPSHEIDEQRKKDRLLVKLRSKTTAMDRDFVLSIGLAKASSPVAYIEEHSNGSKAIMLRLHPEFEAAAEVAAEPRDVIFLVDCSGSMDGSSIEKARRVLEMCVRALSSGDRFEIVRFGSTHECWAKRLREYDQAALDKVTPWIRGMQADLGGTELLPALSAVYGMLKHDRRTEILLITDGQVSNESELFELARQNAAHARIFAFGIGHGSSETLVRGLARESRGLAEFVAPNESIEETILRQFARMDTPVVSEIRFDWDGASVTASPNNPPPLFDGDSFTVFGLCEGKTLPSEVRVTGKFRSEAISWNAPVTNHGKGDLIATLWARNRIRDIESGRLEETGSNQKKRREKSIESRLVELSKKFRLMSRSTSFVGIEIREEDQRVTDRADFVRVPIMLTRDWHGSEQVSCSAIEMISSAACSRSSASVDDFDTPQFLRWGNSISDGDTAFADPQTQVTGPSFRDLLLHQKADGSFELSDELAQMAGSTLTELEEMAHFIKGVTGDEVMRLILATELTLLVLHKKAGAEQIQWRRAETKAKKWLALYATARLHSMPLHDSLETTFGSC